METAKDREQEEARRIGSRITELREARGWTQRLLSQRSGIAPTRLSRIERGLRLPKLPEAMALQEVFALSLEEMLFGGSGEGSEMVELLRRLEALLTPDEAAALQRFLRLVLAGIQAAGPGRGRDPR